MRTRLDNRGAVKVDVKEIPTARLRGRKSTKYLPSQQGQRELRLAHAERWAGRTGSRQGKREKRSVTKVLSRQEIPKEKKREKEGWMGRSEHPNCRSGSTSIQAVYQVPPICRKRGVGRETMRRDGYQFDG